MRQGGQGQDELCAIWAGTASTLLRVGRLAGTATKGKSVPYSPHCTLCVSYRSSLDMFLVGRRSDLNAMAGARRGDGLYMAFGRTKRLLDQICSSSNTHPNVKRMMT
jgi:hypothetical protein